MKGCTKLESGVVELYFYDELSDRDRAAMADHLATCLECRQGLEELEVIRAALLTRPVVSAPPGGDWSDFMARLERHTIDAAGAGAFPAVVATLPQPQSVRRRAMPYLALAATLALAVASLVVAARSGSGRNSTATADAPDVNVASVAPATTPGVQPAGPADETLEAAFAALSEQHFERSKVVVLGIASKDPRRATPEDWEYERRLATSLLTDTRLYRLAAEERGMKRIATVMSDLELVLLQTALGAEAGPEDLEQIQRLIDRRDLVTKMELVAAGI